MSILEKITNTEDYLLGMLLCDPGLLLTVPFDLLIFRKWHRVVALMLTQLNSGIKPDVFTLSEKFPDWDSLVFELELLKNDSKGESGNYKKYLKSLESNVTEVRVFTALKKTLSEIEAGTMPTQAAAGFSAKMMQLTSTANRQYSYNAKELMAGMDAKLKEISENKGKFQIKSGIEKLDRLYGSFHPSDLVVVGARPSIGKTAWGLTVASNIARGGYKVGFISTEMANEQISFRLNSLFSGVDGSKYRYANFDGDEWGRVANGIRDIGKLSINVCDKTEMKVSDVAMQCSAWKINGGLDIVVVDYLTRLKPEREKASKVVEVGEIVTAIKNMARDLRIPVLLLAQLNRAVTTRTDKRPTMADLRDSGVIEQEADSILLLSRATKDDEGARTAIFVDKNRHGQAGMALTVEFDEKTGRWF
ncbi:MAG: DnaB-like helicase C-terminal domain-containing protein [Methyloglobulus sp.]